MEPPRSVGAAQPGDHSPEPPDPPGGGGRGRQTPGTLKVVLSYLLLFAFFALTAALMVWPAAEPPAVPGQRPLVWLQWKERSLAAKRRGQLSDPCRVLLAAFADAFAAFMACSVKAARPLRVCLDCASHRYAVERAFGNIRNGTGPEDSDCHLELLDQDDVHVIAFHLRYYQRVMEQHRCDLCVERLGYGGYRVHPEVQELRKRHDAFRRCVTDRGDVVGPGAGASNQSSSAADRSGTVDRSDAGDESDEGGGSGGAVRPDAGSSGSAAGDARPAACEACAPLLAAQMEQLHLVAGRRVDPAHASCADVEDMANVTSRVWRCHGCSAASPPLGWWTERVPMFAAAALASLFYALLAWRTLPAAALLPARWRRVGGSADGDGRVRPPADGELFRRVTRARLPQEVRRRR